MGEILAVYYGIAVPLSERKGGARKPSRSSNYFDVTADSSR